jgi:hypothetical protein
VCFGFTGCRDTVPHLQRLAVYCGDALTDLEAALRPGAALVHDDWASYETDENLFREGNVASRSTIVKGDAEGAMAGADVVVTGRYVADGSHAVPIDEAVAPSGRATTSRCGRRRRSRSRSGRRRRHAPLALNQVG